MQVLEQMLDNWEQLYQTQKLSLYSQLKQSLPLNDKKKILDEFFSKLETEEKAIKSSVLYKAFREEHFTKKAKSS